jgi:hypothetical protein
MLSCLAAASVIMAGAVIAVAQDATQIKPPTSAAPAKASRTSRRASKKAAAMPACGPGEMEEPNTSAAGQDDPMDGGKNADLSGTYMGTVNYPDGNLSGAATLTINGSSFTLAIDGGETVTGRISAVTTRGYTGATLRFGERTESDKVKTEPIPQVSVRAKKMGDKLSLMSVPEDTRKFSFVPGKMSKKQKAAMCGPM